MKQETAAAKVKSVFDEPIEKRMQIYRKRYDRVLNELKDKPVITVGFQVIHCSIWKYNRVFQLMNQDPLFNPVIFVCPYLRVDRVQMLKEMDATFEEMYSKGYNVIKTYNKKNDNWIDIKSELSPDIVFYSVPYDYTKDEYRIHHFTESLSCYVPYLFTTNGKEAKNYDGPFHNLVWRNFYETEIHKQYAQKYARNRGDNVVISGHPGIDDFLFPSLDSITDPWPLKNHKRIIWAPHHTIDGQGQGLNYSTFTKYHSVFKEIAIEYTDEVQIAFKPHPMLKEKLYKDEDWGKARTDDYYQSWKDMENGLLEQSGYIDLFLTSDALIHDCSSFMVEYLSTRKPVLYLMHDDNVADRLHEFGKIALDKHYKSNNIGEIRSFIDNQVLQSDDFMYPIRAEFVSEFLKQGNGSSASENIIEYLINEIKL